MMPKSEETAMRFQLTSDWVAFHDLAPIPTGSILEGVRPVWFGRELPLPLPIEAQALDSEAAAAMLGWYGSGEYAWLRNRLRFGPNVDPAVSRVPAVGQARIDDERPTWGALVRGY
jgi:hypothetical protein